MSAMVLTFSGSWLELFAWIVLMAWFLGLAFALGWFAHSIRSDR